MLRVPESPNPAMCQPELPCLRESSLLKDQALRSPGMKAPRSNPLCDVFGLLKLVLDFHELSLPTFEIAEPSSSKVPESPFAAAFSFHRRSRATR